MTLRIRNMTPDEKLERLVILENRLMLLGILADDLISDIMSDTLDESVDLFDFVNRGRRIQNKIALECRRIYISLGLDWEKDTC